MVFNSVEFVVFFVVVYGSYRVLPHRWQNWLLLVGSYYFYAAWDWRFLGLLVASTVIDYLCGLFIASRDSRPARRAALVTSLAFNFSMLGFFKYYNFFAANLQALLGAFGVHLELTTLHVLLPIGISFYTFMTVSYVIDVYRRDIEPTRNLLDFAVFVAYFPHLVAGPILRASLLLPQILSRREITSGHVAEGLWLIQYGFFKKMFVADNLATIANAVFAPSAHPTGFDVLLGTYAFAFQIYCDFSGYSDIARGTSKLMGIELNLNFRFPYFVRTPQEFWAHWHISLSTWLRDYLFLPLSYALSRRLDGVRWLGLRDDMWIYSGATLVTMLLGGLWHGAAWTFVLWGAYQGCLLVVFRLAAQSRRRRARSARAVKASVWRRALGVVGMFHLSCLGWVFFRAASVGHIGNLASTLVLGFRPSLSSLVEYGVPLAWATLPLLAIHGIEFAKDDLSIEMKWPFAVRLLVCTAMVCLILLSGNFEGTQFIYFQF